MREILQPGIFIDKNQICVLFWVNSKQFSDHSLVLRFLVVVIEILDSKILGSIAFHQDNSFVDRVGLGGNNSKRAHMVPRLPECQKIHAVASFVGNRDPCSLARSRIACTGHYRSLNRFLFDKHQRRQEDSL